MSGKASPVDPAQYIKPEGASAPEGNDVPEEETEVKFSPEEEAVRLSHRSSHTLTPTFSPTLLVVPDLT